MLSGFFGISLRFSGLIAPAKGKTAVFDKTTEFCDTFYRQSDLLRRVMKSFRLQGGIANAKTPGQEVGFFLRPASGLFFVTVSSSEASIVSQNSVALLKTAVFPLAGKAQAGAGVRMRRHFTYGEQKPFFTQTVCAIRSACTELREKAVAFRRSDSTAALRPSAL